MRLAFAYLAFAAILLGGFQVFYLRMFLIDRAAFGRTLAEAQYRRTPGLRAFLIDVHQRTARGEAIALLTPARSWSQGYEYAYFRSLYPLVGRRVLILIDPRTDEFLWRNLSEADYVAAWRAEPSLEGFEIVWRGNDGVLLRRVR